MFARALCGATLLALLAFSVPVAHAQEEALDRSYDYKLFQSTYDVQKDTSVKVTEVYTYAFTGTYHKGYRSLSHKGADALDDIKVFELVDGTYVPLTYSSEQLDKTDESSWGKYTTYVDSDTAIEWYYDQTDTEHTWMVTYTMRGAVSFYKDHDELYWNAFTNLDAPVEKAEVFVKLPEDNMLPTATVYVNGEHGVTEDRPDARTYHAVATNFEAHEPFTFAVGWGKGVVDVGSYWRYWWGVNWPYVASGLVLLLTAIFCALYWFFTERYKQGKGVIVAQYEPPRGLRPAMVELVAKEHLSGKTWAATIVDLAVRGHIRIEEDTPTALDKIFGVIGFVFLVVMMGGLSVFVALFVSSFASTYVDIPFFVIGGLVTFALVLALFAKGKNLKLVTKNYTLTDLKSGAKREPYEVTFMEDIFGTGSFAEPFSTKKMKYDSVKQRALYYNMLSLEKQVKEETETQTSVYELQHTLTRERVGKIILGVGFGIFAVVFLFLLFFIAGAAPGASIILLLLCIGLSAFTINYFLKYEARLNKEGQILKEEILGFKLYLKTAERYRMQNLTPDMFEKYLPYAIIFGVEKKWAKAFEGLNIPPPDWYSGSTGYAAGAISSSSASSFSASSFAGSFSNSFSSAFSSSGGGGSSSGSSSGGGSSGGGGGGGGGGAS